ncbi:MAG: SDR family NAD(P)-dependent oxidoreductase [Acidobacteriaceae bacterium]
MEPQSTTPFRLDGKRALVTGGASGIGEATCRMLAQAGASVIIADISRERAAALASELPNASALVLDITQPEEVQKAFQSLGDLDILVNNAGIGHVGDLAETEAEDFDRLMNLNVRAVYLVTRAALPLILKSKGSIVNIGSVAGQVGVKRRLAYCTSKGAIIAMTRQIAVDYPLQLRINVICPGTVETPFVEGYLDKYHAHEKEKVRAELNLRQPVGRLGKPEEVAAMVVYLCSKEAEFIHGAALAIDGGWTAA